jgi:hypothetical protein
MAKCIKCGVELVKEQNWSKCCYNRTDRPSPRYICKECYNKKSREYYIKHKDEVIARAIAYKKEHPEIRRKCERNYYRNHKDKIRQKNRKYRKEHPEKIKKAKAKYYRNLGFNPIIENDWENKIHWHHINNIDVVPLPKNLHFMCYTGERESHRKLCKKLINILYEEDLANMKKEMLGKGGL